MARPPRSGAPALPTFPAPTGAVAARAGARSAAVVPSQRSGRRPAPVPAPLGSLVSATGPAAARTACPCCGGGSVTRLAMTLPDGAPVTFVSCHTCETRGWYAADGAPVGLDAVLGGAART